MKDANAFEQMSVIPVVFAEMGKDGAQMSLDEKLRPVGSQSRDFILIRQLHRKELRSGKRWNCRCTFWSYLSP